MTKNKQSLIEIRPRDPKRILTGANCLVFVDGRQVRNATRVRVDVKAGGVGKVTIDLIGKVKASGYVLGDYYPRQAKRKGTK